MLFFSLHSPISCCPKSLSSLASPLVFLLPPFLLHILFFCLEILTQCNSQSSYNNFLKISQEPGVDTHCSLAFSLHYAFTFYIVVMQCAVSWAHQEIFLLKTFAHAVPSARGTLIPFLGLGLNTSLSIRHSPMIILCERIAPPIFQLCLSSSSWFNSLCMAYYYKRCIVVWLLSVSIQWCKVHKGKDSIFCFLPYPWHR